MMTKRCLGITTLMISVLALGVKAEESALDKGFADPPMSARPWLWWYFLGGYGNKEGLAKDTAAFREKGIGGVIHKQHVFGKDVIAPSTKMLSDGWGDWFSAAVGSAGANGLEMSASDMDGWGFGGWWVKPEDENKKLVYSQIQVEGPMKLSRTLPVPSGTNSVYRDVLTLAFPVNGTRPVPPLEVTSDSVKNIAIGEGQKWKAIHAADGDPDTFWRAEPKTNLSGKKDRLTPVAISAEHPAWLQLSYDEPLAATSALVQAMPKAGPKDCELLSSNDGQSFQPISAFTMEPGEGRRISFPETRAKHFRLRITSAHAPDVQLAEFSILRTGDEPVVRPGIAFWDFKSANLAWFRWKADPYVALETEYAKDGLKDLSRQQVLDLSAKMQPDGRLEWEVPPGRWTILRFGWTNLKQLARSAVHGGLEADMLGAKGADLHADASQKRIVEIVQKAGVSKSLQSFHCDSWEIGADTLGQQPTWTGDFREKFIKFRGYDPLPYLPAMARYLVDDRETTERFLRDYRDTVSDLVTEFYDRRRERAHEMGMLLNGQAGYGTYPYPHVDGLKLFGRMDQIQGEVWIQSPIMLIAEPLCDAIRTPASGARIYGRQLVQAEFDGCGWAKYRGPNDLIWRQALHRAYANGLNQAVFNHVEHQPFEDKPGNVYYYMLSRHSPWWPMADATLRYMGRCQYLLQQGLFVADAAYFVGEGASRYVPAKEFLRPALPLGYDFDGINAEVLLTRTKVQDGRLNLTDGLSYRYLVLSQPQCRTLSPEVLQRMATLVKAGMTLVGPPPERAPGLAERDQADKSIKALVAELWGQSPSSEGERKVGKGRVLWGRSMEAILAADGLQPDVEVATDAGNAARSGMAEAKWIWHEQDYCESEYIERDDARLGERFFCATLVIPPGRKAVSAQACMTAESLFALSLNGTEVLKGADPKRALDKPIAVEVLREGTNELQVKAAKIGTGYGPAGVIGIVIVTLDNGQRVVCKTGDETWQSSSDNQRWIPPRIMSALGTWWPWVEVKTAGANPAAAFQWIHRRTADTDIYFLANPSPLKVTGAQASLRATGRQPELFDAMTGVTRPLPQFKVEGDCTVIPLDFEPNEAYFILFRDNKPTAAAQPNMRNFPEYKPAFEVAGPWEVQFDSQWFYPDNGTGGKVRFEQLEDWSKHPEEAIKFYSGLATYATKFQLPAKPQHVAISIGGAGVVARIRVNGKECGVVSCLPWRVEITDAVRQGENVLKIEVANSWGNRLIGDAALPKPERRTKVLAWPDPKTKLFASGLLGPVQVLVGE